MSDFEKLKDELKLKLNEAKNSQELDIIRTNIFGKNRFLKITHLHILMSFIKRTYI